jgi:hypothetical protein
MPLHHRAGDTMQNSNDWETTLAGLALAVAAIRKEHEPSEILEGMTRALGERFRDLHRAPKECRSTTSGHSHDEPARAPVYRGTSALEDHAQRFWREGRAETHVRRYDISHRAMEGDQGHRLHTLADGRRQKRARRGIQGVDRSCRKTSGAETSELHL